jgi:redox-sensitive bicupin YhaK (pirin superfamily)
MTTPQPAADIRRVRPIQGVWRSRPTIEGAGVHLKRAFGADVVPRMDPFLLMDDFHSANPADYSKGFPWHPHRGIETITYVLDGEVDHGDSLGNQGTIGAGDVQWMTAGGGIIHQEMPRGDRKGLNHGFQLWANLPAAHKMMSPRYREVKAAEIPALDTPDGARVRVICGTVGAVSGPIADVDAEPEYLDVRLPAHTRFTHPAPRGRTVLAYVVEGAARFQPEGVGPEGAPGSGPLGAETLVHYGDGESVEIATGSDPARFLLISGRPLREPVAWSGPIVMNTRDEIKRAFEELRAGTFIRPAG